MDKKNTKDKTFHLSSKDLSILIVSYDGAQELWNPFSQAWNQSWSDCNWERVLITQKVTTVPGSCFERIISVPSKASETMYRIKVALEQIDSKYVLIMCDDYFLYDRADARKMMNIIKIMENENISCVHLDNKRMITENIEFKEIKNSNFLVSGGIPSIYEKTFITMLCEKFSNCTMREWELNASRWLRDKQYNIKSVSNSSFKCYHCVLEGYWRMLPYLWTKRRKLEVCYNTYKKPEFVHSIWAVGKAVCFNIVIFFFPRLYDGWSRQKYAKSVDEGEYN